MNVKLKILTAGVLFFIGGQTVMAQKSKKDTADTKNIEEVVVVGMGIKREQKALGYSVNSIAKDAFESKSASDLTTLIAGKAPGVNISIGGGQAGSASNISIRTQKSISGPNGPLWVVDGVAVISSTNSQGNFSNGFNNVTARFQDIDPNSIEDMKILSGLAATNMYGSAGRNGVVLITTKGRGNKERMAVELISSTFMSQISNLPTFQNKYGNGGDFINNNGNLGNWGSAFDSSVLVPHHYNNNYSSAIFPQYAGLLVPYAPVTDNVKKFFKTGFGNTNNIRIFGSGKNFNYNVSGGYTNESGFVKYNNFERLNFSVGGGVQVTPKLRADGDISVINTDYTAPPISASNGSGLSLFDLLLYIPRNLDLNNLPYQNPGTGASVYYRAANDYDNPYWTLNNSRNIQKTNRSIMKFSFDYKILPLFNLAYKIGYDVLNDKQRFYVNRGSTDSSYGVGILRDVYVNQYLLNQNLILTSQKINLWNKINFDFYVGGESRVDEKKQTGLESQNQIQFGQLEHNYFETTSGISKFVGDLDSQERGNVFGVFANATFDYDNSIFLSLSARKDWTSVTEKANNSIVYPSASISFDGLNLFKINNPNINQLKLRAGYGTAAGFPDTYLTRSSVSFNPKGFIGDTSSYVTNSSGSLLGNPDLKPELHQELEFGIESKLFKNRITLNASYYERNSKDQILPRDLDPTTGYTTKYINAGSVKGKGIEALLSITPIKSDDFSWDLDFNFNKTVTRVVSLPDGNKRVNYAGFSNLGIYAIEGEKMGAIVGSYALKDNQGRYLINPANGKIITSSDVGLKDEIIGNTQPDYTLTFTNGFSYKGFSISAQLDFVKGGDIYSETAANLIMRGVTKDTENREGTWVLPGVYANPGSGEIYKDVSGNPIQNTTQLPLQYVYFLNLRNASSEWVYDATRLRLREVTVSYSLPKKVLAGTGLNAFTISVNGNNLWFKAFNMPKYVNVDPELSITRATGGGLDFQSAPASRRIGFSIKATF